MISSLIIDDEEIGRKNLEALLLKHCPEIAITGIAFSVESAVEMIHTVNPDLLFLDIQMKDGTGFDVLRQCTDIQCEVIFVTAFDQYGLHAIKFSAVDYILKPIDDVQLITAVTKAIDQIKLRSENFRLKNLLRNNSQNNPNKRIALPFIDTIEFLEVKTIIRLEADGSYTHFITNDNKNLLVSGSLKEYDEMLIPYGFIRTHQAHLVNPEYIKSLIKADGGTLCLNNGDKVPISRLRKADIIKALKG